MNLSKVFPPLVSELEFIKLFLSEDLRVKGVLSVILENAKASNDVYSLIQFYRIKHRLPLIGLPSSGLKLSGTYSRKTEPDIKNQQHIAALS